MLALALLACAPAPEPPLAVSGSAFLDLDGEGGPDALTVRTGGGAPAVVEAWREGWGERLWVSEAGPPGGLVAAPPVALGELVVVAIAGGDAVLQAHHRRTGQLAWSWATEGHRWRSPPVSDGRSVALLVRDVERQERLVAFDASGAQVLDVPLPAGRAPWATPRSLSSGFWVFGSGVAVHAGAAPAHPHRVPLGEHEPAPNEAFACAFADEPVGHAFTAGLDRDDRLRLVESETGRVAWASAPRRGLQPPVIDGPWALVPLYDRDLGDGALVFDLRAGRAAGVLRLDREPRGARGPVLRLASPPTARDRLLVLDASGQRCVFDLGAWAPIGCSDAKLTFLPDPGALMALTPPGE